MPGKLLIVDDEPDLETLILQKFRKKIHKKQYEFLFAHDGLEAISRLKEHTDVDVILTDINMPKMDGLTLLKELHELQLMAKAVVVSAYGDMDNIRTAMNRGAFDFVTKPIDFSDLEITIEKTLSEIQTLKEGEAAKSRLDVIGQELAMAGKLQQSILPHSYPDRREIAMFGQMTPANNIGGDFYDFFFIDENRLGFVMADVSGKGISAALFMAVSRTLLRFVGIQGYSPGKVLADVNNLLCVDNEISMFVTVFYSILDLRTGEIRFANGGHNQPYKLSPATGLTICARTNGIALGVMEEMEFEEGVITLEPGDIFYTCTDGVTDAVNSNEECFEEERLEEYLKQLTELTPEKIITGTQETVNAFAGDVAQFDDMTQLAVQYLGNPG